MALHAQQTELRMGDGTSPEQFTDVEEVVSISGPDGAANLIDVTHLKSTGKEYLQGLADYGKISLECNFTGETQQMALRTAYANQAAAGNYQLAIPDGNGTYHLFSFAAVVNGWSLSTPTDAKVGLTVSLQCSGSVSYLSAQQ